MPLTVVKRNDEPELRSPDRLTVKMKFFLPLVALTSEMLLMVSVGTPLAVEPVPLAVTGTPPLVDGNRRRGRSKNRKCPGDSSED